MRLPKNLKYTREHEWVLVEGNEATVGITDFAQEQLGEVTYVELPEQGDSVTKDEPFGAVESVKASSDVYAPVSGDVVEVNADLGDRPETVNEDPYGDAWLIRIDMTDPSEMEDLLSADEYRSYVEKEAGADVEVEDD